MSKGTESQANELLSLQMQIYKLRLEAIKRELEDPEGYAGNVAADMQALNTFMKQNSINVTADDKQLSSLQKLLVTDGSKTLEDFDVTQEILKN